MLTLNIPAKKDPIARLTLIGCAVLVVYAAFVSATAPQQVSAQSEIIIIQATPTLPVFVPTPESIQALAPALATPEVVYIEVPGPTPLPEVVYIEVQAQAAPTGDPLPFAPAPDLAQQPGTPEFNAALVEIHNELPTLNCPCGPDTAAETASDAYQQRRLDSGAYRPRTR